MIDHPQFHSSLTIEGNSVFNSGVDSTSGFLTPTLENNRKQLAYKDLDRVSSQRNFLAPSEASSASVFCPAMGMRSLNLTPHSGHTFSPKHVYLPGGSRIILGRSTESDPSLPSNGLFPSEMSISLNHAELWYEDGKIFIRDLGSEQGTSVNYSPIRRPTLVSNGDIVTLGGVMMKVTMS